MTLRESLEKLDSAYWQNDKVKIRPILTQEDLVYAIFDCELTPEQQELVNPAGFSIGRAYLFRERNVPCLICTVEDVPIGFISLCKWLAEGDAYSWSYYIDRRYQGKGYGKAAAQLAIRILKTAAPEKPIKLSTEVENTRAQALYQSLGFTKLDELDGDDLVFAL